MDPIAAKMRDLYDRAASGYVATTGEVDLFPGLDVELARFLRRVPPGGPILDLGSGVGRDTDWFSQQGLSVVAVDLSEGMLRLTSERVPSAAVVQAEMTCLPFQNDCFAGAWVCASLVHLAAVQQPKALSEMYRTLQPGGAVAVSMKAGRSEGWVTGSKLPAERWFTYVDTDEFIELMRTIGFVDLAAFPSGRNTWFIAEGVKRLRLSSTCPDSSSAGSA